MKLNQEKIGKFIAKLRNEKDLTQQELANKIGVTDRAISNWENGRRMPDLSLIKSLCDELGITINELLSGEKIEEKEYQTKFEENVLNAIDYSNKKINKTKRKVIIALSVIGIIILIIISMFLVDVNRMNNNKPVVFSTWGFKYFPTEYLPEVELETAITEYLINKNDSESKHYNNEKWFISFRTYLFEEKEQGNLYNVYAWVVEESYYLNDEEITKDSGSSIPYKFVVKKEDNKYVVADSRIPRDGSLYEADMKIIFPSSVRKDMNNVHIDGTIERLQADINKQAKLYFHK